MSCEHCCPPEIGGADDEVWDPWANRLCALCNQRRGLHQTVCPHETREGCPGFTTSFPFETIITDLQEMVVDFS